MKTPDHSRNPHPRQALNRLARRLSFLAAKDKDPLENEATPMVELTAEQRRPPDREGVESDQDCACK